MFTTGRIIFTIAFVLGFVALMIWSYRSEKNIHKIHFSKSYLILLGIIVIMGLLFAIVKFSKHV